MDESHSQTFPVWGGQDYSQTTDRKNGHGDEANNNPQKLKFNSAVYACM